jgi:hypothetical protein
VENRPKPGSKGVKRITGKGKEGEGITDESYPHYGYNYPQAKFLLLKPLEYKYL